MQLWKGYKISFIETNLTTNSHLKNMHRRKMECVLFSLWVAVAISAQGTIAIASSATWKLFFNQLCVTTSQRSCFFFFHFCRCHCCFSICSWFLKCFHELIVDIHARDFSASWKVHSPFPLYYCQNSNLTMNSRCPNIPFQGSPCKPCLHAPSE